MHWLLILLIVIPAVEIGTFIWVGNIIGGWWVVILILLTGFLGITLAKQQGITTWRSAQQSIQAGRAPGNQILDGICIFVGAVLLFSPGFVTDIIGLLFILPWTRNLLKMVMMKWIMKHMSKGTIIYRK